MDPSKTEEDKKHEVEAMEMATQVEKEENEAPGEEGVTQEEKEIDEEPNIEEPSDEDGKAAPATPEEVCKKKPAGKAKATSKPKPKAGSCGCKVFGFKETKKGSEGRSS